MIFICGICGEKIPDDSGYICSMFSMHQKKIGTAVVLLAAMLALLGILPKWVKGISGETLLVGVHFLYVFFAFLALYLINQWIWQQRPYRRSWVRFVLGLFAGFLLLSLFHFVIYQVYVPLFHYILNLKTVGFGDSLAMTAFRATVLESVVFASLFYFKHQSEKDHYKKEMDRLNLELKQPKPEGNEKEYKNNILIRFRDEIIPIPIVQIAFFQLNNGLVFQHQFSGQKHLQQTSLDALEEELDPHIFFRANRQFILHRNAIRKMEQLEHRKLRVSLVEPFADEIVISKVKATSFVKWIEGKTP